MSAKSIIEDEDDGFDCKSMLCDPYIGQWFKKKHAYERYYQVIKPSKYHPEELVCVTLWHDQKLGVAWKNIYREELNADFDLCDRPALNAGEEDLIVYWTELINKNR